MSAARLAPLPLVLAALAASAPSTAHAARGRDAVSCPIQSIGRCFSVTVPLDRSGAVPGTVRLRAARIPTRRPTRTPLVALTGGPGQAGLAFAETYYLTLPAPGRDLVVLDQRGTGASGLLRCKAFERRVRTVLASPAGTCGRSLGARRPFYTSADSADDLEALRERLGAPRLALYAVSYGTRVALEYAQRYPQRVERMVLDSPVGIGGPDPLVRETLAAVARVVRNLCRDGCGDAAAHPVADLARLRARLRRAPIRVVRHGAPVRIDADDLLNILVTADLAPDLMRQIPGAVRAALRGRPGRLAQLKRVLLGIDTAFPISEFSPALFAATTCEESPLAWDRAADPATRRAQTAAVAQATPASAFYPFDRPAAIAAGLLPLCVDWPTPARTVSPSPPLSTRIPALVLSGDLDLRTPLEKSRELARSLPGAHLLVERGIGHAVLGAEPDGCAGPAVEAFLRGRPLQPCVRGELSLRIATARGSALKRPAGNRRSRRGRMLW